MQKESWRQKQLSGVPHKSEFRWASGVHSLEKEDSVNFLANLPKSCRVLQVEPKKLIKISTKSRIHSNPCSRITLVPSPYWYLFWHHDLMTSQYFGTFDLMAKWIWPQGRLPTKMKDFYSWHLYNFLSTRLWVVDDQQVWLVCYKFATDQICGWSTVQSLMQKCPLGVSNLLTNFKILDTLLHVVQDFWICDAADLYKCWFFNCCVLLHAHTGEATPKVQVSKWYPSLSILVLFCRRFAIAYQDKPQVSK